MKKSLYLLLTIIFLPFYAGAYVFSKSLKIKGNEDMETIKEFLTLWKEEENFID